MTVRQQYQELLLRLREEGKVFSRQHPKLAPFLSDRSRDPDIERLLEGFAYLTAQLHQKIDDELPEITQEFFKTLAPGYLKPLPACTIVQFQPQAQFSDVHRLIARGSEFDIKHQGHNYIFSTSQALNVLPLAIEAIQSKRRDDLLTVSFKVKALGKLSLDQLASPKLQFYLAGDLSKAYARYWLLTKHCRSVQVEVAGRQFDCPQARFVPEGFDNQQTLLPGSHGSYIGFEWLREFYRFPEKFLFVSLDDLGSWQRFGIHDEMIITVNLHVPVEEVIGFDHKSLVLNAVPMVNLFSSSAVPIQRQVGMLRYRVLPNDHRASGNCAVFGIDSVRGWAPVKKARFYYEPWWRFSQLEKLDTPIYNEHIEASSVHAYHNLSLELAPNQNNDSIDETLSIDVKLFQPEAHEHLGLGDVQATETDGLSSLHFENISHVSQPAYPVLYHEINWQLIANLSTAFRKINSIEHLKQCCQAIEGAFSQQHIAQEGTRKLLKSLLRFDTSPSDQFVSGQLIRGYHSVLSVKDAQFLQVGELLLFGNMISRILQHQSPVNSFHTLTIKGLDQGVVLEWPLQQR